MTYTSGDPEVFQKGGWEGEGWLGEIEDEKMGGGVPIFQIFIFVCNLYTLTNKKIKNMFYIAISFFFSSPLPPILLFCIQTF